MRLKQAVLVAGIGLLAAALPLVAHHSFAAEFDSTKAITLQGVVTKLDWMNPHIWIYLDTKDDSGTVAHWQCEGGPPNTLTRNGWSKDSLKIGDQVNIDGFRSKDGSNTCNARSVKLPSGKSVFAGSAEDGGPNKRQ
ncbi:MAG TPA: DUF6152 family protein [Bryobacteraceae bacterium]|jgi:hypothetical protein|nr:DUF6152 family protein [Bryobacteraceae bacterium]